MKYTEVYFCGGTNAVPFNLSNVAMAMPSGSFLKVYQGVEADSAGFSFYGGDVSAVYFTDSGDYIYSGTGLDTEVQPHADPLLLVGLYFGVGFLSAAAFMRKYKI